MFKQVRGLFLGKNKKAKQANSEIVAIFQELQEREGLVDVRLKHADGNLWKMNCKIVSVGKEKLSLVPVQKFSSHWLALVPDEDILECYVPSSTSKTHILHGGVCPVLEPVTEKSLVLGFPERLEQGERRINIRLQPHTEHMPGIHAWSIETQKTENGKTVERNVLFATKPGSKESQRLICNLSSGGIRLSLSKEFLKKKQLNLKKGSKVLLQLDFGALRKEPFWLSAHVNNVHLASEGAYEFGLQFTGYIRNKKEGVWETVDLFGVDDLAKLIQALLAEYKVGDRGVADGEDSKTIAITL